MLIEKVKKLGRNYSKSIFGRLVKSCRSVNNSAVQFCIYSAVWIRLYGQVRNSFLCSSTIKSARVCVRSSNYEKEIPQIASKQEPLSGVCNAKGKNGSDLLFSFGCQGRMRKHSLVASFFSFVISPLPSFPLVSLSCFKMKLLTINKDKHWKEANNYASLEETVKWEPFYFDFL